MMASNPCSYHPPVNIDCSCGEPVEKPFQDIETICRNIEIGFQENDIDYLGQLRLILYGNMTEYPAYQFNFIREMIADKSDAIIKKQEKDKAMQNLCSD